MRVKLRRDLVGVSVPKHGGQKRNRSEDPKKNISKCCSEPEWRMAPEHNRPADGTSFVRGYTAIERFRTIVIMLLTDRYAELHETTRVRERTLFRPQRIPSELELQARWFAGDFGKHFVATTGDKIDIVQFGTWPLRFLVRRNRDERCSKIG